MARSAPLQAFTTDDELYELVRWYIILYHDSSQLELFATLVLLLPLIFFHLNFLLLSFTLNVHVPTLRAILTTFSKVEGVGDMSCLQTVLHCHYILYLCVCVCVCVKAEIHVNSLYLSFSAHHQGRGVVTKVACWIADKWPHNLHMWRQHMS